MASEGITVGDPEWRDGIEDMHRQLRHRPDVTAHVNSVANDMLSLIPSDNYDVLEAGGPQRYRAYVGPSNEHGFQEEIRRSWVLKALAAMVGR